MPYVAGEALQTRLDRSGPLEVCNVLRIAMPTASGLSAAHAQGLGSVMSAMCTGRAPFRAKTSYSVLRRITDDEPRPVREINSGIPEWLCEIIGKLMSKRLEDRFASAGEVAELPENCLAHVH